MFYGYHRVSTKEQHLDRGIRELQEFANQRTIDIQKIFVDKQTGKNFDRPRYTVLKEDVLRPGTRSLLRNATGWEEIKMQYYKNCSILKIII